MSAQQVADRCRELGAPHLKRQMITNLENGRRETVSFVEVLVLALALDVPPLALLMPAGEPLAITPTLSMSPVRLAALFGGLSPAAELPSRGFIQEAGQLREDHAACRKTAMPDRRVTITLSFATDTPPAAVAMAVGHVITAQVPDRMDAITWHGADTEERGRGL